MATYVYCGMWGEHGGNDGLWVHDFDVATGRLGEGRQIDGTIRTSNCFVDAKRGLLYMVDEIDQVESANEVVAFAFDDRGALERTGAGAVVPEEWLARVPKQGGKYEQQDMKLTEDGCFLYTVFRGSADNLVGKKRVHGDGGFQGVAVLEIDQGSGIPRNIQALELDCAWPRGCALSPDERHLVVSCLYSDELIALSVNEDGTLSAVAARVDQTTAANVTFYKAPTA